MTQSRTHTCGELRSADEGKEVTLCGWVENVREVGGNLSFIILRDFYGVTQLVAETEDMVAKFKVITKESTVQITGKVRIRSNKCLLESVVVKLINNFLDGTCAMVRCSV